MADNQLYIFDSSAVIAFLQSKPGAEVVEEVLNDPQNRCLIHTVNVCEIYYDIYRRSGEEDASTLEDILSTMEIALVETLPSALWQTAGKLKAEWRRISLADCFALALAILENGVFLTSDHHEIDPIAQAGVCPVRFIR